MWEYRLTHDDQIMWDPDTHAQTEKKVSKIDLKCQDSLPRQNWLIQDAYYTIKYN